ncbi:asparagine--tRNA ligase [Candidatus Tachikawaea gelatinosa]|uniref:Asparagine--tRNA ligase n=1 Tax=Candidatus Tachikawaea gelatinosa TaxID=1410383 RepID=A0A090AS87_9ENTR|nr:asparagine--tRNA ligase [Candidatus Tachikawaea gelatinosa]BAP58735.1 asparagine--tRNA ligase [Candidatus Tachikawaea gelatinosa]
MKVVSISDVLKHHIKIKTKITVRGWIKTKRDSKSGISFIHIYDGSCINNLQIIVPNTIKNYSEVKKLNSGCSVIILGNLEKSVGRSQIYDLYAHDIKIIGTIKNPENYPISAKNHSIEYLREVSHLRARTKIIGVISRIRHHLAQSFFSFLNQEGFLWIPTPILTSLDTEGAGEMFYVSHMKSTETLQNNQKNFFGKESYLTVSGQLNLECFACALSKVYNFGPVFRAENSNTSRHLSEFWMLEAEIAFYKLNDIIVFIKSMLKNVLENLLKTCMDDIDFLKKTVNENILSHFEYFICNNIEEIEYDDVVKILKKYENNFERKIFWGMDFFAEHEKYITEKYFKKPVIIKNFPKKIKAFYMRLNEDEKTVAAIDVLVPGIGEIIGGSQREERLKYLDNRIQEMGLIKKDYWWYRDLRRYGTVHHSGFGLGFERLLSYVTGIKNVRDVIPFPRTPKNINF